MLLLLLHTSIFKFMGIKWPNCADIKFCRCHLFAAVSLVYVVEWHVCWHSRCFCQFKYISSYCRCMSSDDKKCWHFGHPVSASHVYVDTDKYNVTEELWQMNGIVGERGPSFFHYQLMHHVVTYNYTVVPIGLCMMNFINIGHWCSDAKPPGTERVKGNQM